MILFTCGQITHYQVQYTGQVVERSRLFSKLFQHLR